MKPLESHATAVTCGYRRQRMAQEPRSCSRHVSVGRYYDPGTGQFLSVDPLVDETGQPYAYTGDDPVNGTDPSGLCNLPSGAYLVPGACHWTSSSWALQTEATIEAQGHSGGFSISRGLEGVADFGEGAANSVVSGVTLGHQHIAESFPCVGTWQYDAGEAYGVVAVGLAGAGEADLPEVANEGVYVVRSSLGDYVGQSGNIDQRLAGYVSSGRFTASEVADAERSLVTGGKTAREVAEQLEIDSRGGVANLLNIRNPIGEARFPLMPQPYARP
jgi:RHS repeat-associated protein